MISGFILCHFYAFQTQNNNLRQNSTPWVNVTSVSVPTQNCLKNNSCYVQLELKTCLTLCLSLVHPLRDFVCTRMLKVNIWVFWVPSLTRIKIYIDFKFQSPSGSLDMTSLVTIVTKNFFHQKSKILVLFERALKTDEKWYINHVLIIKCSKVMTGFVFY